MNKDTDSPIHISSKFLRSVNLESDYGRPDCLDNYILQSSTQNLVNTLNTHIATSSQRAFTITGPYGGGKSSLALLIASLVSKDKALKAKAFDLLKQSDEGINAAWKSSNGWSVLPIVGKRESVEASIAHALSQQTNTKISKANPSLIIAELITQAEKYPEEGVLVIIDELGKFLEYATTNEGDIYFYQLLAEAASRCKGKLVVLGILHQSFEQYASKLGKSAQEEWSKIQGRWLDLPLVSATDETVELVGKAIHIKGLPKTQKKVDKLFEVVANSIQRRRPNLSKNFAESLKNCWPINPIVAALLGPISRKKFSQNERTIFSFLTSAEPFGFNEFIHANEHSKLYGPDLFWDYLKANFEQSILQSSDGHRWAIANDAIERTEARDGCQDLHIKIIKTIALLDLFKQTSGLYPEDKVLKSRLSATSQAIESVIQDLARWSIIIQKKHINSWAIFSGSDFDIDRSVNDTRKTIGELDKSYLGSLVDLSVVIAKRHYHQTGSLRWFSKNLCNISDLKGYIQELEPTDAAIGEFILAIPDFTKSDKENHKILEACIKNTVADNAIIGLMKNAEKLNDLGSELIALEAVQNNYRELEGDAVARQEINSRISSLKLELRAELSSSFDHSDWSNPLISGEEKQHNLTLIASDLADKIFHQAPPIFNETINKDYGSSNASLGRKLLMNRMIDFTGQENLGFTNFSVEAGLFYTVLKNNNLYEKNNEAFEFIVPKEGHPFFSLWQCADALFNETDEIVGLDTLYKAWQNPPFGLKKHLCPLIAFAYFLSKKYELILYREKRFIPEITDVTIDEWIMDPAMIGFKGFEWTKDKIQLIKLLSKEMQVNFDVSSEETALGAARSVVQLVMEAPLTSRRTIKLSDQAIKFRDIVQRANDPNKVLFTDLPELFSEKEPMKLIAIIVNNIKEIRQDYPAMLTRYKDKLYSRINHAGEITELNNRAKKILNLGNFNVNSFIKRLEIYDEKIENTEGLLSLAINKQPAEWTDIDREVALTNIGKMCDEFRAIEAMASMRDAEPTRDSFSFVFSDKTVTYNVATNKKKEITQRSKELITLLKKESFSNDEIMATLAEACNATMMIDGDETGEKDG